MLQMLNAQERSESEWREIISAADSHLELTRIIVSNFSDRNPEIHINGNTDFLIA
jgi:hypothetical protein